MLKSLCLLLLPLYCLANSTYASTSVVFACAEASDSQLFSVLTEIYSHFLEPFELDFSMQTTTEQRMISEVASGRIDGACGQSIPMFESLNSPHVVRSSPPIAMLSVRAVSTTHHTSIKSLSELTHSPLRIGIIASTGTALAAQQRGISFQNILHIDRGIRMLAANRLDYVISNHIQIRRALNDVAPLVRLTLSDNLLYLPVHPVLNIKHRQLVPPLNGYLTRLNHCLGGPLSQTNSINWLSLTRKKLEECSESVASHTIIQKNYQAYPNN
ncbi:MAG: hypothetical protein CL693_03095 [Cellvibrionaceae bacterium]|nr:hypothetical protein [Cellvibrionaceae bacterium]